MPRLFNTRILWSYRFFLFFCIPFVSLVSLLSLSPCMPFSFFLSFFLFSLSLSLPLSLFISLCFSQCHIPLLLNCLSLCLPPSHPPSIPSSLPLCVSSSLSSSLSPSLSPLVPFPSLPLSRSLSSIFSVCPLQDDISFPVLVSFAFFIIPCLPFLRLTPSPYMIFFSLSICLICLFSLSCPLCNVNIQYVLFWWKKLFSTCWIIQLKKAKFNTCCSVWAEKHIGHVPNFLLKKHF